MSVTRGIPLISGGRGIVLENQRVRRFVVWSNDEELVAAGAKPYQIAGPVYWYTWISPGVYDTSAVNPAVVAATVPNHLYDSRPFMMDIEAFDLDSDRENAITNLNIAGDAWKETPRSIGYYGILPNHVGHYWTCASYVNDPTPVHVAAYEAWQADNDANWTDLGGNDLHFLCPSLYAFYKPGNASYGTWEACAEGLLDEAVRLADGKAVYPFIWPLYHSSAEGGSTPIALDDWTDQVEYVRGRGDIAGMVIWTPDGAVEGWRDPVLSTVDSVITEPIE